MDSRPIGVFDSGLGGLTVVKEIVKALPKEDIIYLGDTARIPYGTRSKEVVVKFAKEDTKFLLGKRVKCVVIACNTASAFAFRCLKNKYSISIFDVITPASKSVLKKSKNKIVGVIGTRGTIASGAYNRELGEKRNGVKIYAQACPLFVPLIEEGEIGGAIIKAVVKKYLRYFLNKPIDTLILGCTHYPIIKQEIKSFLGRNLTYINPGKEVALELKRYLIKNGLLNNKTKKGNTKYFVTDINKNFKETADMFLEKSISTKIQKVSIS